MRSGTEQQTLLYYRGMHYDIIMCTACNYIIRSSTMCTRLADTHELSLFITIYVQQQYTNVLWSTMSQLCYNNIEELPLNVHMTLCIERSHYCLFCSLRARVCLYVLSRVCFVCYHTTCYIPHLCTGMRSHGVFMNSHPCTKGHNYISILSLICSGNV